LFLGAWLVRDQPWWIVLATAWWGAAFAQHALWVLIHECCHYLVFGSPFLDNIFLVINNMPHIVPSSVTFAHFHRLHHGNLNEVLADPDVPYETEAKLFGTTVVGKFVWLTLLGVFQTLRTQRFSNHFIWNKWLWVNWGVSLSVSYLVLTTWGFKSWMWLLSSNLFCLGFHITGGRWVAEHYAVNPNQETYSYYGPINQVAFNIGYHNEHHDLTHVPWVRLPQVTKVAPEFYNNLTYHSSYIRLILEFLFNPNFTLETRVVRPNHGTVAQYSEEVKND
jgi:sphingolipid delta-4 desaturase